MAIIRLAGRSRLDLVHHKLDAAVCGWDPGITDAEILENLLALNLAAAGLR